MRHAPQHIAGQMPLRGYARPSLPQPPTTGEPENAAEAPHTE